MQPLDHAAVAAGEFEETAGERAGDADCIGHPGGIEPQQMPAGDRGAERPGRARRVEAARLVGVPGGAADPHSAMPRHSGRAGRFPRPSWSPLHGTAASSLSWHSRASDTFARMTTRTRTFFEASPALALTWQRAAPKFHSCEIEAREAGR